MKFHIVKYDDDTRDRSPYQLVETVNTSDGPRSRLTSGRYETREEAALEIVKRTQAMAQEGRSCTASE